MTATKDSTEMAPFAPKQMMPRSPGLLEALVGDVTEQVAAHLLTLIPNIPTKSVIHDNACGTGQVSEAIMSNHPKSITINATDVMPMFLHACTGKAAKNGWPLKAAVMDAQKLTFPDSTFTHSFMNMALFSIPDATSTVKHVHRTLQSGGIAFSTTWAVESQGHAVKAGHDTTRGGGSLAVSISPEWHAEEKLRSTLERGGFSAGNIKMSQHEVFLKIEDLDQWVQIAWSYLGRPSSGWAKEDEEKWDQAVAAVKNALEKDKNFEPLQSGESRFRMVANVAVATKQGND